MSVRVPDGFADRVWDGSAGEAFTPTSDDLPTYTEDGVRRVVPPFDMLDQRGWRTLGLAVGPRTELAVVVDDTAVGQVVASVVVEANHATIAVGRGAAPDVLIRTRATDLVRVRAGHADFLTLFASPTAALEGDDAALLYLAGLFDDEFWQQDWAVSPAGAAAAEQLVELLDESS